MHAIQGVWIEGNTVHIVCTCGWKTKKCTDETAARALYERHCEYVKQEPPEPSETETPQTETPQTETSENGG